LGNDEQWNIIFLPYVLWLMHLFIKNNQVLETCHNFHIDLSSVVLRTTNDDEMMKKIQDEVSFK
jgi:hypothetical protein